MSKVVQKVEKVALEEDKNAKVGFENAPKLFSKWSYDDIKVSLFWSQIEDPCFIDYIAAKSTKAQVFVPHTAGRYQAKKFRKALCPIVERLVGSMQFHGRNTGKKVKAIRIVRHAFEIIHLLTGRNPLEVFVNAVLQAGPR
jgi:small subunit ribosomal protein S5e